MALTIVINSQNTATADLRNLKKQLNSLRSEFKAFESTVKQSNNTAQSGGRVLRNYSAGLDVLSNAYFFATAGAIDFVRSSIDAAGRTELLEQSLRSAGHNVGIVSTNLRQLAKDVIGIDYEQAVRNFRNLTQAGFETADAYTAIRGTALALGEAGASTQDGARLWHNYTQIIRRGKTEQEDINTILEVAPSLIEDMNKALGTNIKTSEDFNNHLKETGRTAAQTLAEVSKYQAATRKGISSDSFIGQQERLNESLNELRLTLGRNILPMLTEFVGKINDLVKRYEELEPTERQQINNKIKLGAAIGGLVIASGPLVNVFKVLGTVFKVAGGAIKSLITTVPNLGTHLKTLFSTISSFTTSVAPKFINFLSGAVSQTGLLVAAFTTLATAWVKIYNAFQNTGSIDAAFEKVVDLKNDAEGLQQTLDRLRQRLIIRINAGAARSELDAIRERIKELLALQKELNEAQQAPQESPKLRADELKETEVQTEARIANAKRAREAEVASFEEAARKGAEYADQLRTKKQAATDARIENAKRARDVEIASFEEAARKGAEYADQLRRLLGTDPDVRQQQIDERIASQGQRGTNLSDLQSEAARQGNAFVDRLQQMQANAVKNNLEKQYRSYQLFATRVSNELINIFSRLAQGQEINLGQILARFASFGARLIIQEKLTAAFRKRIDDEVTAHILANRAKIAGANTAGAAAGIPNIGGAAGIASTIGSGGSLLAILGGAAALAGIATAVVSVMDKNKTLRKLDFERLYNAEPTRSRTVILQVDRRELARTVIDANATGEVRMNLEPV